MSNESDKTEPQVENQAWSPGRAHTATDLSANKGEFNSAHVGGSSPIQNPSVAEVRPGSPPLAGSGAEPPSTGRALSPARWRANLRDYRIIGLLVLAFISFPAYRALLGSPKPHATAPESSSGLPVVAVEKVQRRDLFTEIPILAEFRPFAEVELHAKVSGYVQEITVDIGDQVKAGQLLARLEVPELTNELEQAVAVQHRAEADYRAAHLAYSRLLAVDKLNQNLVVQQDLDAAEAKDRTAEAAIAAAKADAEKYETMLAYTRITAPFDGVVTRRYADPGALIQSGTASATQSLPLLRISQNYRLRLDFPVPVSNVKEVRVGDPVEVRVESLGDKTFVGTISRFAHKVDDDTRTMLTEIEVPNPDLQLMPGMYAKAVLKVQKCPNVLTIPATAVASGKHPTVYVIDPNGVVEERAVSLGLETPGYYEVKSGLHEGDLVLVGARSATRPGEKVQPKMVTALASQ